MAIMVGVSIPRSYGVWRGGGGTEDGADWTSFVVAHMLGGESTGDSGNRGNPLPPVTGTCMTSSGSTPCERGRMGSGGTRGP